MIPSPTGKGILMIGGYKYKIRASVGIASSDILELSGDSKKKLRWKFLQQKLQYPRAFHSTFSIPNQIAVDLCAKLQRRSRLRKMILRARRSRKK